MITSRILPFTGIAALLFKSYKLSFFYTHIFREESTVLSDSRQGPRFLLLYFSIILKSLLTLYERDSSQSLLPLLIGC